MRQIVAEIFQSIFQDWIDNGGIGKWEIGDFSLVFVFCT